MADTLSRLRALWDNMSQTNRVILVCLVLAAVVSGVVIVPWAGSQEYVPLVSNASPHDLQGILAKLRDSKVDYKVQPDGSTILVPATSKPQLLLELSGDGLMNSGSIGWSAVDNLRFGATQAMEQQAFRRARQIDVQSAIETCDGVTKAIVEYTPGSDSPFVGDTHDSRAAVLVHLSPGHEMTRKNVQAVVALVARAFDGLVPRNISVMDGAMQPLWDGAKQEEGVWTTGERREEEQAYADRLKRDLETLIRPTAGTGKFALTVNATLDLDHTTETTEEKTPGTAKQKTTSSITYKGAGSVSINPPAGVAANANGAVPPTRMQSDFPGEPGSMTNDTTSATFDTGTHKKEVVTSPGEAKTIRVAVFLDTSVSVDAAKAIETAVRTQIGTDTTNPDARAVTVNRLPMTNADETTAAREAAEAASSEKINRWVSFGVPIALMLLMLVILARSLRPRHMLGALRVATPRQPLLAGAAPGGGSIDLRVGDDDLEGRSVQEALDGGPIPVAAKGARKAHSYEVIEEAFDANLASIVDFAKNRPEIVAAMIRSWMAEEKR